MSKYGNAFKKCLVTLNITLNDITVHLHRHKLRIAKLEFNPLINPYLVGVKFRKWSVTFYLTDSH